MLKVLARSVTIILIIFSAGNSYSQRNYQTPYSIKFTFPEDSLIYDLLYSDRGNFLNSSVIPFEEWDSKAVSNKFGAWGPPVKQYSFPPLAKDKSADWLRERVIAVARLFIGYEYQHHHIPVWDPPADRKWKKTCAGKNGKGADCSNFTSFVYNVSLGIKLKSNIIKQSRETYLSSNNIRDFQTAETIYPPENYQDYSNTFKTGDLLFVKNVRGNISHVIIWLGKTGNSTDNTPLIIDSHGAEVKDCNGNNIPCGIFIRPFLKNSWYYKSFSHALRVIKD